MCGIIGIVDKQEEVFEQLVVGLRSLQHRGQDACGIVTSSQNKLNIKKELGSVDRAFIHQDSFLLKGKYGIGHTRYATQGAGTINDAAPLIDNATQKISLALNGNIINYFELREKFISSGKKLKTTVDTELLLELFFEKYKETKDFMQSARNILENAKGAYSIIGTIAGVGIYAIRDPRGIRPLVLGKANNSSYVIASESVTLQTLGYKYVRDIKPGEAILIKNNLEIQNKIILEKPRAHCMFEWVYFANPTSMIEGRSVYKSRLALGKLLGKYIDKADVDIVTPVPDSGRTSAIKLAEELQVKYREGLIKDRYASRTFIMASQRLREKAVQKKLIPIISILKDNRVAIVDDSIVRGTTSKRIINVLKNEGVKKITFVSSCPPIKYPCYYGINFPTKNELVAGKRTFEEIKEYLDCEKLIYASTDDIKAAIRKDVCMACLTGKYPEEISDMEKRCLAKQRIEEEKKVDKKMNVLIIGNGGREHALALKISKSNNLKKLYTIPKNPGIEKLGECFDLDIMDNSKIVSFAKEKSIDMVVVGPEAPLANGIVDSLEANGIKAFGVNKSASRFESSKAYSRRFMKKYNLPSVEFEEFTDLTKAILYIKKKGTPIVVKADGLAAGKGVLVAGTVKEATEFARECLENNKFGKASSSIVIEECLIGEEASYLLFLDSNTFKPMVYSQDHKAIFEQDKGPNTGGMGAYSPAPILNGCEEEIEEKIVKPFINGIKQEGIDFRGVLYVGLMKTKNGLKILEFNCRFGDPETQIILPRLKTDILEVFEAVIDKKLCDIELDWSNEHCTCIVLASKGYPGSYEKGFEITGLDDLGDVEVIYAGTKEVNGKIVTNGGRVLNVVSTGKNLSIATTKAYENIKKINFDGMYYRTDIGKKELDRQE
jgi:phosphoribosylamine---glycine ligase